MRILLDECVPKRLGKELTGPPRSQAELRNEGKVLN